MQIGATVQEEKGEKQTYTYIAHIQVDGTKSILLKEQEINYNNSRYIQLSRIYVGYRKNTLQK